MPLARVFPGGGAKHDEKWGSGRKRLGGSDAVHKLCVTGRTIRMSEAVIGRIRPMSLRKYLPGHPGFHLGFMDFPNQPTDAANGNNGRRSGSHGAILSEVNLVRIGVQD
jgi:hypothetical protein